MTCRHAAGDRSCSSHPDHPDNPVNRRYEEIISKTPDADKYQIIEALRVGTHLVLKVKYPNCFLCVFEGTKILVFLNVSEIQALMWRRIDPHFRNDKSLISTQAPSPSARFPATSEGWSDAIAYAKSKLPLPKDFK